MSERPPEDIRITATVRQFARISGLSPATIWKMIASKQVQSVKIMGVRLIVLDSYRAILDEQLGVHIGPHPSMTNRGNNGGKQAIAGNQSIDNDT